MARGETQKPSITSGTGTGANSSTSPSYDGGNHGVMNPMDPAVEAGGDFYDTAGTGAY